MARYRRIDVRIWNDAKFNSLSTDAKLIFLYLLTSPHTLPIGAVPVAKETVQRSIGINDKQYAIGYDILYRMGIVEYDDRGLFLIKNWFKYNQPDNPKIVVSWSQYFDVLPECPLLSEICKNVVNACAARGADYSEKLDQRYYEISETVFGTVSDTVSDTVCDIKEYRVKSIDINNKQQTTSAREENPQPLKTETDSSTKIGTTVVPKTVLAEKKEEPELFSEPNEPTEEKKPKVKPKVFKFPYTEIPEKWLNLCQSAYPNLDPIKEFMSCRFYFTDGQGANTMRSEKGWNQTWANWLNRAKPAPVQQTVKTPQRPANRPQPFNEFANMDYSKGISKTGRIL